MDTDLFLIEYASTTLQDLSEKNVETLFDRQEKKPCHHWTQIIDDIINPCKIIQRMRCVMNPVFVHCVYGSGVWLYKLTLVSKVKNVQKRHHITFSYKSKPNHLSKMLQENIIEHKVVNTFKKVPSVSICFRKDCLKKLHVRVVNFQLSSG